MTEYQADTLIVAVLSGVLVGWWAVRRLIFGHNCPDCHGWGENHDVFCQRCEGTGRR